MSFNNLLILAGKVGERIAHVYLSVILSKLSHMIFCKILDFLDLYHSCYFRPKAPYPL